MSDPLKLPSEAEAVRNRILFTLIERASGIKHWKSPFEMKIMLADPVGPPIPREDVLPFMRDIGSAIEFFHGAAVALDLETREARAVRGEPAAYVLFDGRTLTIGSAGYQAW